MSKEFIHYASSHPPHRRHRPYRTRRHRHLAGGRSDSAAVHARQGLIHTGTHRAHLTGLIPPGPFSVTREASGLIPPGPFNATSQVG